MSLIIFFNYFCNIFRLYILEQTHNIKYRTNAFHFYKLCTCNPERTQIFHFFLIIFSIVIVFYYYRNYFFQKLYLMIVLIKNLEKIMAASSDEYYNMVYQNFSQTKNPKVHGWHAWECSIYICMY